MNLKSTCLFWTSISIVGRIIYIITSIFVKSNLPSRVVIFNVLLLVFALSLVIANSKKPLDSLAFVPFFILEIAVVIANILICNHEGIEKFTVYESGLIGSGWDVLINSILVIFIMGKYIRKDRSAKL